jgi:hypothetical protein
VRHSVTQSKRWGEILRVDFKIPNEDLSPLVTAYLLADACWEFAIERRYWVESAAAGQAQLARR